MRWVSDDDDDRIAAWERVRFQAFISSGEARPTVTEFLRALSR